MALHSAGIAGGEPLLSSDRRTREFRSRPLVLPKNALNRRLPGITKRDAFIRRVGSGGIFEARSAEWQIAWPLAGAACRLVLRPYRAIHLIFA